MGNRWGRRGPVARRMAALAAALVILAGTVAVAQNPSSDNDHFQGTYAELKPQQKALIDEWYADYDKMTGEKDPPTDYDTLSLSTRTTFEAVTHALLNTNLTDKSGKPMGNALELVEAIETINGKVPRARGDLQFRMYVVLKPDAREKLKQSSEFFRDRDNTVYHHGYPVNWRQAGGAPSIQVSMAKDGRHADIDVDYRSSGFPAALFNGHLSAANSDVRAGDNTQRHIGRWEGLTDWWRDLFGLSGGSAVADVEKPEEGEVPAIPRKADGKLEDAVMDFLTSWLVEQKPELAASYLGPRAFSCLAEYGPQAGRVINAGVAPYVAAKDLAATNKLMGKPANLQTAVVASLVTDPAFQPIKQRYNKTFALYQISNAVAAQYECDPERAFKDYDSARLTKKQSKTGRYFASVFQLKPPHGEDDTITMLWTREGKLWKIVAWDLERGDTKRAAVPDTRPAPKPVVEERITGDAGFLQASHKFLSDWLLKDNFDVAATYFSQQAYGCIGSYLPMNAPAPKTPEESAAYIKQSLTTIAKDMGPVRHLHDATEPLEPDHDDLKLVAHADQDAYTAVAVPPSLLPSFTCEKQMSPPPEDPAQAETEPKEYGKYYATMFSLKTPGDHPAALSILWSKVDGNWKIISYAIVTP